MKNKITLLKIEWIKCLNQKEFKVSFSFMMIMVMASFVIEVATVFGKNVMWLRPVAQNSFMMGIYSQNLFQFYTFFFPLICTSMYALSFIKEQQNGTDINYYIRIGYAKYIRNKVIIVFWGTFAVIVVPMLFNLLLCKITFPVVGSDDNMLDNHFTERIYSQFFCGELFEQQPEKYIILMILINGLCGGTVALLALGISMLPVLKNCDPYIFCIGFFIIYESISIVLQNFARIELDYAFYLNPLVSYEVWQLGCFLVFHAIAAFVLIRKEIQREEHL